MIRNGERSSFLVADDAPRVAVRVAELLLEAGVDVVDTAADGAEALRRFEQSRPDGVVLDIAMPHLDGLSVLRAIRARGAGHESRPWVIVMTAHDEPAWREHALGAGADHFLHKARDLERLLEIVPGLLAQRARRGGGLCTRGGKRPAVRKA
jgi:two-component system response regulator FimZ (fimbrial Z protein)